MDRSLPRLTHDDYTVAFICPMGVELAPAEAMLDEMHQSLPASRYNNSYTLGCMGAHNVVIAVMPEIGNNYAATVVWSPEVGMEVVAYSVRQSRAARTWRAASISLFGLLVGIGGGIPGDGENDIRLGDVVVSKPTATFGGVIQFDRGKVHSNRKFERTGTLKKPPAVLMASVQRLESQHRRVGNQISKYLSEMLQKFPKMEEEQYVYQGMEHDQLFEASYIHETGKTCQQCDRTKVVERAPRRNTTPRIHYGSIGSANEVIKDSKTRDELRGDLGIICVEMEAAGLMDEFSCLVIRGICDYADSHKNKSWQPYAAATAAAYAKELLSIIPAQDIVNATKVADGLQTLNGTPGLPELNSPNAFGRSRFDKQGRLLGELLYSGSPGVGRDSEGSIDLVLRVKTPPSYERHRTREVVKDVDSGDAGLGGYKPIVPDRGAAVKGFEPVARPMLKRRVELNTVYDIWGLTPLHLAARDGNTVMAKQLLEGGADIDPRTRYSRDTPLSEAARGGHEEMVEVLLANGATPAAQGKMKRTALHEAAEKGHLKVVCILLENGADLNVRDERGETALELASQKNHRAVIRQLRKYAH
ncbi:MAG: hypothetical protein M1813_000958 [Trichoglossum hirsutum]|nr:MAG: hypothetical protein M1813_000958 [Trichoglossum hirsutum]